LFNASNEIEAYTSTLALFPVPNNLIRKAYPWGLILFIQSSKE
jgi:hypothetical protein